jgi:O-antigen ligase
MVSTRTQLSLLKSASLLVLFLYVSGGARVAVADRQSSFFKGLLTGSEALSFICGIVYVLFGYSLFGNPNSLGAIMGVAVVPILSWGFLVAENQQVRHRRMAALCVAAYLLVSSYSRAGILASGISLTVMCLALRRTRLLLKGSVALAFLITALGVVQPSKFDALVSSFTEQLIYKGKMEQGLLGSRKSPWQDTVAVIRESPWFGSGFGTDNLPGLVVPDSSIRTTECTSREHGSSYIALLQYVGLLGVVPFAILLLLVIYQILRTLVWMRRTGNPRNYAVPLAMLCLAGLLHAVFEDWLFAAGYYLNLLFWTSAFLLTDFLPARSGGASAVSTAIRRPATHGSQVPIFAGK